MDILRIYNKNGRRIELVLDQEVLKDGANADTIAYNGKMEGITTVQEAIDFICSWAIDSTGIENLMADNEYQTKEQVANLINSAFRQANLPIKGEKE